VKKSLVYVKKFFNYLQTETAFFVGQYEIIIVTAVTFLIFNDNS